MRRAAGTVGLMRVSLLITCLADLFQPEVGVASVQLLRAAGCEVSVPLGQTCCGQPAWNSGFADEAAKVARTTLAALEDDHADAVVVPAGSCATMVRVFWPELFEVVGDHAARDRAIALGKRTFELSEFLAARDLPLSGAEPTQVAYHRSCHMLRELGIAEQPEQLLAAAGCSSSDWPDAERCCGFGGLFSVKLPETSVAMADEKLDTLPADATCLVGSDGSCLMHLRARLEERGSTVKVRHLAEVLAERIDATGGRA